VGQVCAVNGHRNDPKNFRFVAIVAGEASADLHGSNLVKAMKCLDPDIAFWGIGGQKMERAGVKIFVSASDMAVVGVTEVLCRFHTIVRAVRKLKSLLKTNPPDLLILIDYPEFNLYIARIAKRFHVPVLYYISPQVWAWRVGRIRKIARRVDRMAVILPFEKEFYMKRGMQVDYVGHPVLDCGAASGHHRDTIGFKETRSHECRNAESVIKCPVIGLVPGSRTEEIRNLLPVMVDAVDNLKRHYGSVRCVLPLAHTIDPGFVQPFIRDASVDIEVLQGGIHEALDGCDMAFVTSGTATLETAIMEIPMVIVYKVSRVSYWVGKNVIKVPFIGLVNLVAGEKIVTELIQDKAVPESLADEALRILENDAVRESMKKKLSAVKESLGRGGASEKTARIALEMMR